MCTFVAHAFAVHILLRTRFLRTHVLSTGVPSQPSTTDDRRVQYTGLQHACTTVLPDEKHYSGMGGNPNSNPSTAGTGFQATHSSKVYASVRGYSVLGVCQDETTKLPSGRDPSVTHTSTSPDLAD